jgi:hypothetical protein
MTVDCRQQVCFGEHGESVVGLFLRSQQGNSSEQEDLAAPIAGGKGILPMEFDPARAVVAARLAALQLDMASVSRAIGANSAYLQQYLRRGIPRVLPEDRREKLAAILQVSPDALRGAVYGKGGPKPYEASSVAVTADEAQLLRTYREAPAQARPYILRAAQSFKDDPSTT